MFDKKGSLKIRAYTAGGALPVEGALVRIFGADDENENIVYSLVTDIDGTTEKIELPAPSKILSEYPSSRETPYASYNVEIEKNGYFTKKLYNLPVFDGVNSELPIAMIPYSELPENYPRGNVNSFTAST